MPANTPTVEWTPSAVATSKRDFAFRRYLGLACGRRTTWIHATDAADAAAQEAAASGVDTIAADDRGDLVAVERKHLAPRYLADMRRLDAVIDTVKIRLRDTVVARVQRCVRCVVPAR